MHRDAETRQSIGTQTIGGKDKYVRFSRRMFTHPSLVRRRREPAQAPPSSNVLTCTDVSRRTAYAEFMLTPDIAHLENLLELFRKIDAVSRCAQDPRDYVDRQIGMARRRERRDGNSHAASPSRVRAAALSTPSASTRRAVKGRREAHT
jgi:hypothetical protein